MNIWLLPSLTILLVLVYEVWLVAAGRSRPEGMARSIHAGLRKDWFLALSEQKGTELLAVQTLRNSLMSSTVIASTSVLGLMGALNLSATSLNQGMVAGWPAFTPRLAMELVVISLLFLSMLSSVFAVRLYTHASFAGGLPIGSEARAKWAEAGQYYVTKAGMHFGWALRQLILVVPVVASIFHPLAGLVAALVVIATLLFLDKSSQGSL